MLAPTTRGDLTDVPVDTNRLDVADVATRGASSIIAAEEIHTLHVRRSMTAEEGAPR